MVFCHEWVQVGDGEMCALPLRDDLRAAAGEPVLLFHASDAPWAAPIQGDKYVTDGPFLHRTAGGDLLMLWASIGPEGYAEGVARSESGTILGPWRQNPEPLFRRDGGHGMLFRTFEGELMLTLHRPNKSPDERPRFFRVREDGAGLVIVDE
jgi:hypothetical protein